MESKIRFKEPSKVPSDLVTYFKSEYEFPKGPQRANFARYAAFIILGIAISLLLVASFGVGETFLDRLGDSYKAIYTKTTDGTPWTSIMQDNYYLFLIPAAVIFFGLGMKTTLAFGNRAILMAISLGIGFVGGHVFWGGG